MTNLANYVQPVIRYQLGGQRGCLGGAVLGAEACSRRSRADRRTDEILRVRSSGGGEAVLLPMAIATVVEETPGVRRYQVGSDS